MKIALASSRITDRDIKYNVSQMERYMLEARGNGASLVCFGEAFLQGFNALSWRFEEDRAIARTTSSYEFAQIKALTKEIGIDVLFGYNELESDRIYSSCAVIADGEIIHNYRRISKGWKEYSQTDEHYKEGDTVKAFEYKGKNVLLPFAVICGSIPTDLSLVKRFFFGPYMYAGLKKNGRPAARSNMPNKHRGAVRTLFL